MLGCIHFVRVQTAANRAEIELFYQGISVVASGIMDMSVLPVVNFCGRFAPIPNGTKITCHIFTSQNVGLIKEKRWITPALSCFVFDSTCADAWRTVVAAVHGGNLGGQVNAIWRGDP